MSDAWILALAYLGVMALAVFVILVVKTLAELRGRKGPMERRFRRHISPFEEPSTHGH
jgi:hypothetical protein